MKHLTAFAGAVTAALILVLALAYHPGFTTTGLTPEMTKTVPKTTTPTTPKTTSGTQTVTTPTGIEAPAASVIAIAANTFTVNFPTGPAPLGVTFSSSQAWGMTVDFGDGQRAVLPKCSGACNAQSATINHTYKAAGTYKAALINTYASPFQTLSILTIVVRPN